MVKAAALAGKAPLLALGGPVPSLVLGWGEVVPGFEEVGSLGDGEATVEVSDGFCGGQTGAASFVAEAEGILDVGFG